MERYPQLLPYAVAIGSTAIALLLKLWLEPLLTQSLGAFFYITVLISSWYGGFRAGIVAVILSTLAINYFFFLPRYQIGLSQPKNVFQLGIFLLIAFTIALLTSNFVNSKRKVQQLSQQLARENATQLQMALSAACMGIWDWDIVTGLIKWSPELEQLLGLAVGTFDGQYETFNTCVHPDDRQALNQVVQEALQTHSPYQHEFRVIWADGSTHWIEGRGYPFYNSASQPVRIMGTAMVIDKRKQAENALRQSEQRYRALVNASYQIVWRTDSDGNTIAAPEGWEELTGQSVAQCLGWGWLNVVHPEDRESSAQCWREAYRNRTLYVTEYRLRMKDGDYRNFAVRGVPILDVDGKISEWIGTCTDITERKRAEIALQKSQIQLQQQLAEIEIIYQSAPIGLNVLDTDLRFVRINERLAEINGFSVEAHIGRTVRELLPELADTAEQLLRSILVTGKPLLNVEISGETPAQLGVQRTWLESFLPLKDGSRIIGISTVCEEITERKRAEQSLQEREATLRLFIRYAPAGIAMFDRNMRYLMASQRWVDDHNLDSVESLIGRSHYEIFPEISERWQQIHQRCLAGASEKCDEDLFVRLDGSQQWIRWEVHPWHTTTGEIGGIIIFGDDITQRKQAQIALQQLNAELEERVAERTAQLSQANERLLETVREQQQIQLILLEQAQLLDLAHDTIMTCDLNGAIAFWNEGAEFMYGWTKAEALGQIFHTLLKTQFPRPFTDIEAELVEKGYWEGELVHFSRDARPINVASRWVLQKDNAGKPIKILQINNDITERKQAQLALRESEERRRLALDLTHIGCWDLHLPSRNLAWNDNHFTLLGLAPYAIEPSYDIWRNRVHPEDIDWVEQRFWESIKNRTDYTAEYRVVHPDGSVHWLMTRGRAIYDESEQPVRSLGVVLDITERKHTEAVLRQYERIVSTAKDGIALLDRNHIYKIVNPAYLDWYNKSNSEVVGHSVRDVLGENLFDNFIRSQLDRCLTGETIQYERWFDSPNLAQQFISFTYTPYYELNGSISGVIINQRDLTRLKQAEQMLELQAVITRNMAEGICLVRSDNAIIIYANPKFEQMFGYDSGELNGQHVSIVNYENEHMTAEEVNQAIRSAVLENEEATYEVHNVKKDGTPFWCRATCSVFKHPEYGDVLVAVHQDITDRKRIEEALRESEEKFRQLAENIQTVFWMTDIHYKQFLYISPVYETIWGMSCESLYQNFSFWLDAIHPDDRQCVEIVFMEQRTEQYDVKYRIIRPDGSIRWIRDRAFPIKNELGEIVRIAGLAEDITEQQKIEQMKSEFIGIVSHELRTPLTAIRAALGLLKTGIYDKKPDKFKRMIDIAAIDSERLVRLVNDILDLERLDSGRAVLEKTTCHAADLIQIAVEGVQAIADKQHISFDIHSTDAKVWASADAIIQTLTNLLSNALKFSPPNSTITLSVEQQTNSYLFQITDRGRGIPPEKLEAIFGRFQQVDASDARDKGGTGLGLAICRSIIEQHGGQIWVESTIGVGSTFFFTLPF
ncbi:hypothetical protein NUACC21_44800 [Scytonema sp. NUACC21]